MAERRNIYLQGYFFELIILFCVPLALAVNESVPPIILAIVGFITTVYIAMGWLLQPLLKKRTPQSIVLWFSPIVLLAIAGTIYQLDILVLGPFLVYLSTASARGQRRDIHRLMPVGLVEWTGAIIAIILAALIIALIVYFPAICQWLIIVLMKL